MQNVQLAIINAKVPFPCPTVCVRGHFELLILHCFFLCGLRVLCGEKIQPKGNDEHQISRPYMHSSK